jgi:hypothetical protein
MSRDRPASARAARNHNDEYVLVHMVCILQRGRASNRGAPRPAPSGAEPPIEGRRAHGSGGGSSLRGDPQLVARPLVCFVPVLDLNLMHIHAFTPVGTAILIIVNGGEPPYS